MIIKWLLDIWTLSYRILGSFPSVLLPWTKLRGSFWILNCLRVPFKGWALHKNCSSIHRNSQGYNWLHFCLSFRYVWQLCLSSLDCFCWRFCTSPNIVSMATLTHRRKLYLQCTRCTIVNAVDRTGSVFVYTGSDAVQFHDRKDSIQWVVNVKIKKNKGLQNHFWASGYILSLDGLFTNMFLSLVLDWNFSNMEHFLVHDFKNYRLLYVSCNVLSISRYET